MSVDVRSVRDLLRAASARCPHKVALRDAAGAVTYAELVRSAEVTAAWLRANGVRPGDRVLVRAGANRCTVAAMFACMDLGAVFVPFNTDLTRYQVTHIVADAEPVLVLTDDARLLDWLTCHVATMQEVASAPAPMPVPPPETAGDDDLALLLYTSGSTAQPKGVAGTHAQVSFAASAVASRVRYLEDDVVFCRLPLSFDYGLYQVFLAFGACATLVLADATTDARLLSELKANQATVVPVVPSIATMLLKLAARGRARTRIRLFTNTGEHLSASTAEELRAAFSGAGVQLMFGTTECKRITVLEIDGDRERPGSVGRALPGTEVRVLGADGTDLPAGAMGEISVRGPHVMSGYWRAPELSAERFRTDSVTGERFLLTGDYGHLDADGYLYFSGRKDHQFKIRGVRTSAVEIEAAALTVAGVGQAVVLPPTTQRDAVLCVVADRSRQEVLSGVRALLGAAKVPPICEIVPTMPLNANGKVDRGLLRRMLDRSSALLSGETQAAERNVEPTRGDGEVNAKC